MITEKITHIINRQSACGTLFTPEKNNKSGVIFVHGWGSSQDGYVERAEALCELGYTCLTIDLRGFGKSEGDFKKLSILDHLEDLISWYDFLTIKGITDISLCGASYGCALCSLASEKRKVSSLVLRAPGIYSDDILRNDNWTNEDLLLDEIWKFDSKEKFQNSKIINCIKNFDKPILVVGSSDDTKIPKIVVEEYYASAIKTNMKKLIWIDKGDHALTTQESKNKYIQILVKWYKNL